MIFHDDTVQHQSLTVGQIRNFPVKNCSDLNEVKMRLEPLRLEPFEPEHPHKVSPLFKEGVNFTERIKRCEFTPNIEKIAPKGVISHGNCVFVILFVGSISAILYVLCWHSMTEIDT